MASIHDSLNGLLGIDGALCAALVDSTSGARRALRRSSSASDASIRRGQPRSQRASSASTPLMLQAAKAATIPALYFTNLISARPLMGPAGAGSLAAVINAAIANKHRFEAMSAFFGDAGQGDKAGVWTDTPQARPEFRADFKRQVIKLHAKRKAEAMI
mgnify:CR=1 FL=1